MKYEIIGTPFPVVVCELDKGESMLCDSGAMAWMDPCMDMETTSNGGFGKAMGRMFSGETIFLNRFTATNNGKIAFSSSFAGEIRKMDIGPGREIILQKSAFVACEDTVERTTFFNKKFSTGLFAGEGFIMSKYSGHGALFVEIDGACVEYDLAPGQQIIVDSGNLAMMDATCKMEIRSVSGFKNKILGGEGFFNTVITGPGKVYLQTMPVSNLANVISRYIVPKG